MQIVELGDCSMVIMKDSSDAPWETPGYIYRAAKEYDRRIFVQRLVGDGTDPRHYQTVQRSSDSIYTAGRLILFFNEDINPAFQLHDNVHLMY